MEEVDFEAWGEVREYSEEDYNVILISDVSAIGMIATTPRDYSRALSSGSSTLARRSIGAIQSQRNDADDAWLYLCFRS